MTPPPRSAARAVLLLAALLLGLAMAAELATTAARAGPLQPTAQVLDAFAEVRQCGAPARLADGSIRRRADVLHAFRKLHPCPPTGTTVGACAGWAINHVIPLASGGCDAVSNLQWLPLQAKACAEWWCVDRWERTYWGAPHGLVAAPLSSSAPQPAQ